MKSSPKRKKADRCSETNPLGAGRKNIDVHHMCMMVHNKAPLGLSDQKLYQFLKISKESFYKLKKNEEDFRTVMEFYNHRSTIAVIKSFTKIAVGYEFDEVTQELSKGKNGKMEMKVTKIVRKHITPNADAAFKFLKNRDPEHFRDRVEQEHSFSESSMDRVSFIIKANDKEP